MVVAGAGAVVDGVDLGAAGCVTSQVWALEAMRDPDCRGGSGVSVGRVFAPMVIPRASSPQLELAGAQSAA